MTSAMAPRLAAPFRLFAHEVLGSTNDEAARMAAEGFGHGTVVTAGRQTAGRGRHNRPWESLAGNLHCSILVDPRCSLAEGPQLGFVAAVALRDALASFVPDMACKWPNDLLWRGRKIAGMLLERADELVVIGMGVNVVRMPETPLYPTAALAEANSAASAGDILERFCAELPGWLGVWHEQGFAAIRNAWIERAAGMGGQITVRLPSGSLSGRFVDLDETGAMVLEPAVGPRRRIVAGDVFIG